MHTVARSKNYAILADHDYVYLEQEGKLQSIGWMYGNAQAALFDFHERWVVIIGHGAWVIRLPLAAGLTADKAPSFNIRETLAGKAQAFDDAPFVCLMDTAEDDLWPKVVCWTDAKGMQTIRIFSEEHDKDFGIYDLNVKTLTVEKTIFTIPLPRDMD